MRAQQEVAHLAEAQINKPEVERSCSLGATPTNIARDRCAPRTVGKVL